MGNKTTLNGFDGKTTTEMVLKDRKFDGKHFLITGCSKNGLGYETARVLYNANGIVTICGRNKEKIEISKSMLLKQAPKDCKGEIRCEIFDLGSQKGIKEFLEEYKKKNEQIDVVICNAGQMANPKRIIEETKFESQIGINHFGHFSLVIGLLPFVKEPGRIVIVSSRAHRRGIINFEDMHFEKRKYTPWSAYGQSKIANIYFSNELQRRLQLAEKQITANSLHPGVILTNLGRDNPILKKFRNSDGSYNPFYGAITKLFMKTIPQGAATTIYLATDERVKGKGGLYYADCNETEPIEIAKNMDIAKRLFDLSEKVTEMKFPFDFVEEKEKEEEIPEEKKEEEEKIVIAEEKKEEQEKEKEEKKEEELN